jgi:hypothetical protein
MKTRLLALATALLLGWPAVSAAAPTWVDWTSTTTGTMGTNAVAMDGPVWQIADGSAYYIDPLVTQDNTYGGLDPFDVVQILYPGTFTLSFSQSVNNLYMSLVSIGNSTQPVRYQFSDAFSIAFSGGNEWGAGTCTALGNVMTGVECNGILLISGNFGPNHPLVFSVLDAEGWHGFNVAAVPEPETWAMLLAGLGMVGALAGRRRT